MRRRGKLQNRMLYETHARMRFDMSEGSDAYKEGWERIFGKSDTEKGWGFRLAKDHPLRVTLRKLGLGD